MTATDLSQTATFAVDVPADLIRLAAPVVADHLQITVSEAMEQLLLGRVTLASRSAAARLLPLLRALGLSPELQVEHRVTLAVQAVDRDCALHLAPSLAAVLNRDAGPVLAALQTIGGVILTDVSADWATDLRLRLRRLKGLRLTLAHGLSDLFAIAPLHPATRRGLRRHLAMMAAVPCRFSGALAAGLTDLQSAQLIARFDDSGLCVLNRAFQRFDLFLTGTHGLAAQDVAEFLATRTDLADAMVETATPLTPLQLERGLSRAATRQFRADYAAIGLETCARLARF